MTQLTPDHAGSFVAGIIRQRPGWRHRAARAGFMKTVVVASMFELHPAGSMLIFNSQLFEVGADGVWRNEVGQIPAGQVVQ